MKLYKETKTFMKLILNGLLGKDVVTLLWTPGVFKINDQNLYDPQTMCSFMCEFRKSTGNLYSIHAEFIEPFSISDLVDDTLEDLAWEERKKSEIVNEARKKARLRLKQLGKD